MLLYKTSAFQDSYFYRNALVAASEKIWRTSYLANCKLPCRFIKYFITRVRFKNINTDDSRIYGFTMRIDETVQFLELGGVWKYQRNYHLISYRLSFNVLHEIADAKNLHSHFLFFFFSFKNWNVVFNFSIRSCWKTFCRSMWSENGFVE